MARVRDIVTETVRAAARRADSEALAALYAAVSVSTEGERSRLRRAGRPFIDPEASEPTPAPDVRRTAERLVAQASFRGTALGGLAGMGGAATLPPEVAATLVAHLRLAQRLAIVYGLDPETDRGQLALRRALSGGLQVDLPPSGPRGMRVSDLPRTLAPRAVAMDSTAALTRALLRKTAGFVVGRIGRYVPGVAPAVGAFSLRRQLRTAGDRMVDVLERMADLPLEDGAGIVEAEEIVAEGR